MKKIHLIPVFLLCALFTIQVNAQQPVKEHKLVGNWKMIIDIDEELEEAEREMDEEDSFLGKITLSWVSGIVSGVLDEIEIYMEFQPKGELKIIVDAFGEREIEYGTWEIDRKGRLFISDSDSYNSGDNDYWMFEDDILVNFEGSNRHSDHNVYMVSID